MSGGFDLEDWCESNLSRWTKSSGDEFTCECPFCGKWSSFYINCGDSDKHGAYVCFACDQRGRDAAQLIAHVEGISWAEAKRFIFTNTIKLRRKTELFSLSDRIRGLRDKERPADRSEVEYPLPKGFKPVWDEKKEKWSYPTYLKERRIKPATAKAWGLGYCRFGDYAGRLIVPILCPNGYSFTGRAMDAGVEPKYKNPTGADHGRLFIGWEQADLHGDFVLVEGPFDAIKFSQHGIPALAVGGKVLHTEQLQMLFTLRASQAVTVCLDPEEKLAPLDVASQLAVHFWTVNVAELPMGTDPGDSTASVGRAAVANAGRFTGARGARIRARLGKSAAKRDSRFGV